jgi:RsiW-degrading membrane proteinase PrsW (M82 family)
VLYILTPFIYGGADLLPTNVTVAALAAIGLSFGFGLISIGRNSLRGIPSATFHPPSPWRFVSLFVLCLIAGQLMLFLLPTARLTSWAFPPLHILAAASPALAVLAFVGRRTRAASRRTVGLELSFGALLAPMGALAAELIVILVVVIAVAVVVVLMPGGIEALVDLSKSLQDPSWIEDPANLAQLVLSPAALTIIVVVFVILAPLIEEFLKGLGVLLLGYRLSGQAEALLWGVACGAGFAIGESFFNGSIALEGWGAVMVMRWGASLMHCIASGVMGLGWHGALVERRPWRLLAAFGASTGIHALWNGAAVAVALPSLLIMSRPEDLTAQSFAALIVIAALSVLILLTISMIFVTVRLSREVGRASIEEDPAGPEVA